jgi:hypothetical protein
MLFGVGRVIELLVADHDLSAGGMGGKLDRHSRIMKEWEIQGAFTIGGGCVGEWSDNHLPMDEQRLFGAALIAQRRTVERNFPPGPERDAWLAWLGRVKAYGRFPVSEEMWTARSRRGAEVRLVPTDAD